MQSRGGGQSEARPELATGPRASLRGETTQLRQRGLRNDYLTYRTADGRDLELPAYLDCWVLVPLELAHDEPELTWALECRDAPELMLEEALGSLAVDDELDFSNGALLVPVDRWHERLQRQLVASAGISSAAAAPMQRPLLGTPAVRGSPDPFLDQPLAPRQPHGRLTAAIDRAWWLAFVAARLIGIALLAFATIAVGAFVLGLRDGVVLDEVVEGIVLLVGCWTLGHAAERLDCDGAAVAFAVLAAASAVGLIAALAGVP